MKEYGKEIYCIHMSFLITPDAIVPCLMIVALYQNNLSDALFSYRLFAVHFRSLPSLSLVYVTASAVISLLRVTFIHNILSHYHFCRSPHLNCSFLKLST